MGPRAHARTAAKTADTLQLLNYSIVGLGRATPIHLETTLRSVPPNVLAFAQKPVCEGGLLRRGVLRFVNWLLLSLIAGLTEKDVGVMEGDDCFCVDYFAGCNHR